MGKLDFFKYASSVDDEPPYSVCAIDQYGNPRSYQDALSIVKECFDPLDEDRYRYVYNGITEYYIEVDQFDQWTLDTRALCETGNTLYGPYDFYKIDIEEDDDQTV